MKIFVILLSTLMMTAIAQAGEPKAALCLDVAHKGAIELFKINHNITGPLGEYFSVTNLLSMNHSEGGTEVWDVTITFKNVTYAPYRMTVLADGCQIIRFEMINAS